MHTKGEFTHINVTNLVFISVNTTVARSRIFQYFHSIGTPNWLVLFVTVWKKVLARKLWTSLEAKH